MAVIPSRDVAEFVGFGGYGAVSATAGGAGDVTEIDGAAVNRNSYNMPESGWILVQYKTTLGASETLALTVKIQESADGSTWDTAVVLANAVTVKTGALTDSEDHYLVKVKLSDRKQYIRAQVTPDLSASSTDTAIVAFNVGFGPGKDTGALDAPDASDE